MKDLDFQQRYQWGAVIRMFDKYPTLHKFYSSTEGWAALSFKQKSIRVDHSLGLEEIEKRVNNLLNTEQ